MNDQNQNPKNQSFIDLNTSNPSEQIHQLASQAESIAQPEAAEQAEIQRQMTDVTVNSSGDDLTRSLERQRPAQDDEPGFDTSVDRSLNTPNHDEIFNKQRGNQTAVAAGHIVNYALRPDADPAERPKQ